ncbi:MAG: hypothetical protein KDD62_01020 [Bdellovibrionales bacterium]|nr:hypothetical protein [Bdellovibrionales bacterium]
MGLDMTPSGNNRRFDSPDVGGGIGGTGPEPTPERNEDVAPGSGNFSSKLSDFIKDYHIRSGSELEQERNPEVETKRERKRSTERTRTAERTDLTDTEFRIEAAKSFAHGMLSPVFSLFKSPKNMIIAGALIVGLGIAAYAVPAVTAGILIAGAGLGVFQVGTYLDARKKATNDTEKARSYYHLGQAATTIGVTATGLAGIWGVVGTIAEEAGTALGFIEAIQVASAEAEVAAAAAAAAEEAQAGSTFSDIMDGLSDLVLPDADQHDVGNKD